MRSYKKPLIALLVLVLAGLWAWRYYSFNQKINSIYSTPIIYYSLGQDVAYDGAIMKSYTYEDCSIRLNKVQRLSLGETYQIMSPGQSPIYEGGLDEDSPALLLEMGFTNLSPANQYFALRDLEIQSEADPTISAQQFPGFDSQMYQRGMILVPSQKTVTFHTPFILPHDSEVDLGDIYLVVTRFPVEKRIQLA